MDRLLQSSGKRLHAPCSWYITQGWLQIPTQLKPTQAQSWDNTTAATTKSKIPGVQQLKTSKHTNILMQLLSRNIGNNYSKQPVFTGGIFCISWQWNGKTIVPLKREIKNTSDIALPSASLLTYSTETAGNTISLWNTCYSTHLDLHHVSCLIPTFWSYHII